MASNALAELLRLMQLQERGQKIYDPLRGGANFDPQSVLPVQRAGFTLVPAEEFQRAQEQVQGQSSFSPNDPRNPAVLAQYRAQSNADLRKQLGMSPLATPENVAQQKLQDEIDSRRILKQLSAQGNELGTAALGRALLPYDPSTGINLIKAAKEEQRQQSLLDRTGGTGVAAPVGYRWTSDGNLEAIPKGPADPKVVADLSESRRTAQEKALPATAAQKLIENSQNLRRAEQALALVQGKEVSGIKGDVEATGWKGYAPQALLNRFDPAGADTRAALADLGSLILHERSGAAVTAAEEPRLRPFIPSVTDDAATIQKKLTRFKQVYEDLVGDTANFYKESGYKVPSEVLRHAEITGQGSEKQQTHNSLPDPRQYSGKIARDTETGTRWISNGSDWVRAP